MNREAKAVTLKDLSFPASRFTHFGEVPKQRWASLPASETLTHTLIVSPKRAGELIVSPASVSYLDDGDNKITRIATDDILSVEKLLDWRRRTDRHTKEWSMYMCAFALLCIAPFGVSLFMERGVPNGNKKKN